MQVCVPLANQFGYQYSPFGGDSGRTSKAIAGFAVGVRLGFDVGALLGILDGAGVVITTDAAEVWTAGVDVVDVAAVTVVASVDVIPSKASELNTSNHFDASNAGAEFCCVDDVDDTTLCSVCVESEGFCCVGEVDDATLLCSVCVEFIILELNVSCPVPSDAVDALTTENLAETKTSPVLGYLVGRLVEELSSSLGDTDGIANDKLAVESSFRLGEADGILVERRPDGSDALGDADDDDDASPVTSSWGTEDLDVSSPLWLDNVTPRIIPTNKRTNIGTIAA